MKGSLVCSVLIALWCAAVTCQVDAQTTREQWRQQLHKGEAAMKVKAIEALAQQAQTEDIELIIEALQNDVRIVRMAAEHALVQIGKPALEPLVPLLGARKWQVFTAVMEIFQKIGPSATDVLIKALQNPNSRTRINASTVLGRIGDRRAVTPLITLLADRKRAVAKAAASALVEIGAISVPYVILLLKHPQSQVRAYAAWILGEIRDERAIRPLIAALNDPKAKVRRQLKKALSSFGEMAIEDLIAAIKDAPARSQTSIAEILGMSGSEEVLDPLLRLLKSPNKETRKAAIVALGYIKQTRSVPPLLDLLRQDISYSRCIRKTLLRIGRPAVHPLILALEDKDWNMRSFVSAILLKMGRNAASGLVEALGYQTGNIAKYVPDILLRIGRRAVVALVKGLDNEDEYIRLQVARLLGQIGDRRALPRLEEALLNDRSEHVCAAIRKAIRQIRGN